jgi:2-isopropylmalate synthase
VLRAEGAAQGPWNLAGMDVSVHGGQQAVAQIRLSHADGRSIECQAQGDGPVDAAYKAIEKGTGVSVKVRKFEVHAVTLGEDAQGEAILHVEYGDRSYRGSSVSTNIIEASSKALLEVINRIEHSGRNASRMAGDRSDAPAGAPAKPVPAAKAAIAKAGS